MKYGAKLVLVAGILLLAGCSRITPENYQQLKVGMTFDDVTALLGQPDDCPEALVGVKTCYWQSGSKRIEINFMMDRVAIYTKEGF